MKKLLKLISLLMICGLLLLSGCGTTSTSFPTELRRQKNYYPQSVNIIAPNFFKATGAANAEEAKQQWLDEISERYGVKLNVISSQNYGTSSESTGSTASVPTDDIDFTGIVSIDSIHELKSVINGSEIFDSFMPLEGYLEKNAIWNSLPDDFKSLFEIDGHIYAIPTSISRNLSARIILDEALRETGIVVTDLDSFRDFALAYEQETGNAVAKAIHVPDAMDILNAFGLYPGNDISVPFSYDPTEDCFVDWLTKPATVDALQYLRGLYNAGALYSGPDSKKMAATFESGMFPSIYQQYFDYDNSTEVLTLNPQYPQAIFADISGFAMTSSTPQPQETINFLVDMLFGSEQSYLQFWLGSSKNYTVNSDGTITIAMIQDSNGNYIAPCRPNLAGELSDIFPYSEADILYSKNGVIDAKSKTDSENYNDRLKLLDESLKNGTAIVIPPQYQIIESTTYYANINDPSASGKAVYGIYMGCFVAAIIRQDKTVQQVIDEYKEEMLNLGGNQMLDEMNAAIGKETAYYYG